MEWLWLLLIILLILFLMAPSFKKRKLYQRYYAHRGLYSDEVVLVENSLIAFEESMRDGYGIELDVQLSADNVVVVYHDDDLSRLHGLDSPVSSLSADELKVFGIPTLKETLKLINGRVGLIVELKSKYRRELLSEQTNEILKSYHGDVVVESFDPRIVGWFKKNEPEMNRGQLIMPIKKYDHKLMGLFINSLLYNFLTRPHFLAMHSDSYKYHVPMWINKLLGVQIVRWTVFKDDQYAKKHADAIIFEFFKPTSRN